MFSLSNRITRIVNSVFYSILTLLSKLFHFTSNFTVEMTKKKVSSPTENKTQNIPPSSNTSSTNANKKTTRREELLKQLRAVEDAIARKRSKIN